MSLHAPRALQDAYAEWNWEVVWEFPPHTITYRLTHPEYSTRYLKLTRVSWYPSLEHEAARMQWARLYLPVPAVLDTGEREGVEWLLTDALPGIPASGLDLGVSPDRVVDLLAGGLRRWHGVPVTACPFDFRLKVALAHVKQRIQLGEIEAARDFHPEHQHLSIEAALDRLERTRPATEDLVVCHGDYCLPNVLIAGGEVVGFVDLGEVGVADRWWDLAVATWSLEWNLGPGYEARFLAAYGVPMDQERLAYYRLLYDLVS